MIVWLVLFYRDGNAPTPSDSDDGSRWEIAGVYDSEEKAVDACKDWRYLIGPLTLNQATPAERTAWPGSYFPKADIDSVDPV